MYEFTKIILNPVIIKFKIIPSFFYVPIYKYLEEEFNIIFLQAHFRNILIKEPFIN